MWYFLSQKVDGKMIFPDYWKVLVLNFSVMGNMVFFWAKKLMVRWYLLITKKVLFWTFRWWEIWSFFEWRSWWKRWYLLITKKFFFWTFRWWEIRSFFESRSWWKDDIYWLPRSSCFKRFGDVKYDLFFSQKVDGKVIFTWYFWAFHDIPGPGKYGFSWSVTIDQCRGYCTQTDLLNLTKFHIWVVFRGEGLVQKR